MSSFDVFYHYDSANPNLSDDKRLALAVPEEGSYQISVANIYVKFDAAYTPPVSTAYLVLDTNENPNRGICVVGRRGEKGKISEINFPLSNPDQSRPSSSVYNFVRLSPGETIGVSYYDDNYQKIKTVERLIVTLHLQSKK